MFPASLRLLIFKRRHILQLLCFIPCKGLSFQQQKVSFPPFSFLLLIWEPLWNATRDLSRLRAKTPPRIKMKSQYSVKSFRCHYSNASHVRHFFSLKKKITTNHRCSVSSGTFDGLRNYSTFSPTQQRPASFELIGFFIALAEALLALWSLSLLSRPSAFERSLFFFFCFL